MAMRPPALCFLRCCLNNSKNREASSNFGGFRASLGLCASTKSYASIPSSEPKPLHMPLNTPTPHKTLVHRLLRSPAFSGLVLLAFVFMRAIVPAGFMPNDGTSQAFYMFCYSASGAAELASLGSPSATQQQHHEHGHHNHNAASLNKSTPAEHHEHQKSNNTLCEFAAFSANIALGFVILCAMFWPCRLRIKALIQRATLAAQAYTLPAVRAPPLFIA